jgi:pyruvate/2-oxoacid:ferredoxin oxidoreductase alpha subunit
VAIPDVSTYAPIEHTFAKPGEPFQPYARDPETLARQFAVPGTPGLEHRIGGLEAANGSGNISYEPKNHDLMVRLRQAKIDGITVPDLEVDDPTGDAELLMVGWGSSATVPSARPAGGHGARASRSRTRSCATSTRSRPTWARCCAATRRSCCRR